MKILKVMLVMAFLFPGLAQAKASYTLLETCRSQYLNKPGVGVYKNAVCTTEFNIKKGEIDGGIAFLRVSENEILTNIRWVMRLISMWAGDIVLNGQRSI